MTTILYTTLVYRYGLREWHVGLFGLGLCFALVFSLMLYDYWCAGASSPFLGGAPQATRSRRYRRYGVYGNLAVFGPCGILVYLLQALFAKSSLAAFASIFIGSIIALGPLFNTPTMIITNISRTYAPGTEGTALSYASLLHNAAQAAGPVLYMYVQTTFGWRAPWILSAAVTASYASYTVLTRIRYPLPPDTFIPSCDFEMRTFGVAPSIGRVDADAENATLKGPP